MNESRRLPLYMETTEIRYSRRDFADLAGVEEQIIVQYQELGILPEENLGGEDLRRFRHVERLRVVSQCNEVGLRVFSRMLDEVERLRDSLRRR